MIFSTSSQPISNIFVGHPAPDLKLKDLHIHDVQRSSLKGNIEPDGIQASRAGSSFSPNWANFARREGENVDTMRQFHRMCPVCVFPRPSAYLRRAGRNTGPLDSVLASPIFDPKAAAPQKCNRILLR